MHNRVWYYHPNWTVLLMSLSPVPAHSCWCTDTDTAAAINELSRSKTGYENMYIQSSLWCNSHCWRFAQHCLSRVQTELQYVWHWACRVSRWQREIAAWSVLLKSVYTKNIVFQSAAHYLRHSLRFCSHIGMSRQCCRAELVYLGVTESIGRWSRKPTFAVKGNGCRAISAWAYRQVAHLLFP